MSTKIMTACWSLQMRPSPKAVLVSLADNANDDGYCWPSIERISERTCLSRRAVIDAIGWLERAGAVVANRDNGRHTTYVVTPDSFDPLFTEKPLRSVTRDEKTSANAAPVQELHPCKCRLNPCKCRTTPVQMPHLPVQMPHTNRHITVNEPSIEPPRNTRAKVALKIPDLVARGVGEKIARDFLSARKTKFTETALAGFEREAAKAGITLADAIATATERGWQGFRADWVAQKANPNQLQANGAYLTPYQRILANNAKAGRDFADEIMAEEAAKTVIDIGHVRQEVSHALK